MAINVNIPGIGTVTIEGAASEDTVKQLLSAMRAMNANARRSSPQQSPASGGGVPPAVNTGWQGMVNATRAQVAQQGLLSRALSGTTGLLKTFGVSLTSAITSITKDIAKTGLALATSWLTSPDALAADPIRAGAEIINTGIDLAAKALTSLTDVVGKVAGGLPLVGGVIRGASEAFKGAIELAATALKTANEFMAAEFQKTVQSFGALNRIGATFAGGMDEMNDVVTSSGISMSKFTEAVANSRENITAMGVNAANAAKIVASGLSRLATTTGTSGKALREELLLLGFDYKEQGELVAEYTANMIAAGRNRADIDRDVATGTAKYAKDLKILSDITGEDARKKMQEARRESMRASLMNKLSGDQREAFQKAYASLAQAGPEVQEALVQKLAIGEVINPSVAMNESLMGLINNVSTSVNSGSKTVVADTLTFLSETAAALREKQQDLGTALDIAKIAGATGVVATGADIFNRVAAIQITPEQIAQSKAAIASNIENSGQSGEAFSRAAKATNDFAVTMEGIARKNMPEYANLIAFSTTTVKDALDKALAEANKIGKIGIENYANEKVTEIKDQLGDTFSKFQKYLSDEFIPKLRDAVSEALPWWLGGNRGRAAAQAAAADRARAAQQQSAAAAAGDSEAAAAAMQGTPLGTTGEGGIGIGNFLNRLFGREVPQQALGGTVSGPRSGYPVLLHGTEAVVPLPDGRSIPVDISQQLNLSDAFNTEKLEEMLFKQTEQMEILNARIAEMVSVLEEHRDISRDIYDVTA